MSVHPTYFDLATPLQITMPALHHSVFAGWMPFLPPNQQHQGTEGQSIEG